MKVPHQRKCIDQLMKSNFFIYFFKELMEIINFDMNIHYGNERHENMILNYSCCHIIKSMGLKFSS